MFEIPTIMELKELSRNHVVVTSASNIASSGRLVISAVPEVH